MRSKIGPKIRTGRGSVEAPNSTMLAAESQVPCSHLRWPSSCAMTASTSSSHISSSRAFSWTGVPPSMRHGDASSGLDGMHDDEWSLGLDRQRVRIWHRILPHEELGSLLLWNVQHRTGVLEELVQPRILMLAYQDRGADVVLIDALLDYGDHPAHGLPDAGYPLQRLGLAAV
mmetsp:Transcript_88844/g.287318  ORF Transcript_88844/g.287318 Transcript_88844/m.287318 type:complete len:173 (+) Transcript_88844:415-933(+)